ncbi:MAG: ABC transporter ATP-binding protein [Ilumatobacteraceae bacterium]
MTDTDRVTPPLVRAMSLSVRYGGVHALRDVDFELEAGEFCGVIGPNGAGKTTLFDVISGHRVPTSGRLEFVGQDITSTGPAWRARHGLRRTFQRQQVFGTLTVEQNVLAAQDWRGGEGGFLYDLLGSPGRTKVRDERRERASLVLERCGLTGNRDHRAGTLPIGAARMVELARAVVDEPQVILLDEPTSGLGRDDTALLAQVVQNLRATTGCAVLLIEHDVRFVMENSTRVVVMHLGEKLAEGTPAAVQANPDVLQAYLG